MKETVKTSRTAGYLEKIFRALNAKYFNGELEEPIITIQSTPRAYGHVTVAKAWQRGDTTRHELNIGAGTLARPIENVVATTLHTHNGRLHPYDTLCLLCEYTHSFRSWCPIAVLRCVLSEICSLEF